MSDPALRPYWVMTAQAPRRVFAVVWAPNIAAASTEGIVMYLLDPSDPRAADRPG